MRVALLHNAVSPDAPAPEQDVLVQADAVARALAELGHAPVRVAASLDLSRVRDDLERVAPDVVFNLVESLGGSDRLSYLATGLLDGLGYRYTGSPTEALFPLGSKLAAKRRMRAAGLPTPDWIEAGDARSGSPASETRPSSGPRDACILKPVYEHASFGMTSASVVRAEGLGALQGRLAVEQRRLGTVLFAERYVEGREFNQSLLDGAAGPQVLPPAEIDFSAFPPAMPRIVDHRAKWEAESFEYDNTPRRFDFPPSDRALLAELGNLARCCWRLFGLRGYARVDFRVDGGGRPWILEINANPCLSPDAGFAAALQRAVISFSEAVERILEAAISAPAQGSKPLDFADAASPHSAPTSNHEPP